MSDHNSPRARLDLIAEPGVVEVLLALSEHGGHATVEQLRSVGVASRPQQLRRLVAAGHVQRLGAGTLDGDPGRDATQALTATGQGVVATLTKIRQWGERQPRATQEAIGRNRGRWFGLLSRRTG